jgi:hypothetical protein
MKKKKPERLHSPVWWVKQYQTGKMTEAQVEAGMKRDFREAQRRRAAAGVKRSRAGKRWWAGLSDLERERHHCKSERGACEGFARKFNNDRALQRCLDESDPNWREQFRQPGCPRLGTSPQEPS